MIADDHKVDFIIASFINLEDQLLTCMEFIPFTEHNRTIVSPKFVPIILEACTLIDSILYELSGSQSRKPTFRNHAKLQEQNLDLADTTSILLTTPIDFLKPYDNWSKRVPVWWNSYNKLKHDRFNNYEFATYETAIQSLTGLHQLLSKSRLFTSHLIKNGWFNIRGDLTSELLYDRVMECGIPMGIIPCESKLIVSPLSYNIVELQNGEPVIQECDFSDRVMIMLSLSGMY